MNLRKKVFMVSLVAGAVFITEVAHHFQPDPPIHIDSKTNTTRHALPVNRKPHVPQQDYKGPPRVNHRTIVASTSSATHYGNPRLL